MTGPAQAPGPTPVTGRPLIAISVIVPAYNEERHLPACLDSLLAQRLDPERYEIIVVDDGSTDHTADVAVRDRVRLIRTAHRGPGLARNIGAAQASGEILAFLDADMTFDPDFLTELVAPIERGDSIGTFTREEFVANADRAWARHPGLAVGLPGDRRMPADHGPISAVYRAVRADEFRRVGGYDDVGTGEDATLSAKLGRPADLVAGARCFHTNPVSVAEVFGSARWYGRSRVGGAASVGEYLRLSPPASLLRALRAGRRHRSWSLVGYRLTVDAGTLAGRLDRDLLRRGHAR